MSAKMGGFRSPKGIRKPELKAPGALGGKSMINPMAGPSMPSLGGGMGGAGFKKGGPVRAKAKKAKK